jgi:CRISPR-associated protein Cas1
VNPPSSISNISITNTSSSKKNAGKANWATRGDYWERRVNPVSQYKARKRRKINKPLVLSGHGIRLNVDAGTLLITCGFTHYPQEREEHRFFPNDRQLPSRIVILDGDGSITMDALKWLSEQGVPLVQIDWRGELSGVSGAHYAANPEIVKRQLAILDNGKGFEFSKALVADKLNFASETIRQISGDSVDSKPICQKIKAQLACIKKNNPKSIGELRNIEAIAAAAYFRYWYTLNVKWKGIGRKPIPEEWTQVGTRIGKNGNRNEYSVHPVNSILNYAYAVLESQIRGQILAAGLDPSIGYMHSMKQGNSALVFDLMEPARPIMDLKILEFVLGKTFQPDDFILNKNGMVRLHPQMARYVVKLVQDIPEIESITAKNLKHLCNQ